MDLHNSELWISIIQLCHNSIMDLHDSIMDLHNSNMDLHNSIMDLRNSIEPVSAFSPANNPGRANENPIWWRWHGDTESHAILPSTDV